MAVPPERTIQGLSLCAGIGGLELGLQLALPTYRTVCYVEREAFPAAHLVARMEEGSLAQAAVWSDVRSFDGRPFRRRIHLLTAGYPCQPFSLAGRGLGDKDHRHVWPDVARIIGEVRPEIVFAENVKGHLRRGLSVVRDDLRDLGYCVAPPLIASAAEMGAGHIRDRIFILAYAPGIRRREGWPRADARQGRPSARGVGEGDAPAVPAYADGQGLSHPWPCISPPKQSLPQCRAFWAAEPSVARVVHGLPRRVDRVRALGNAVVPAVATYAFATLYGKVFDGDD